MKNRPGPAHAGTGARAAGHGHNPLVTYELTGTIRWLDVELERLVINVEATDGHAGRFRDRDVTVDLEMARVHGATIEALLPGERARIRLRLPRDLGAALPGMVAALSVELLPT